jgi:hypothetical protein
MPITLPFAACGVNCVMLVLRVGLKAASLKLRMPGLGVLAKRT